MGMQNENKRILMLFWCFLTCYIISSFKTGFVSFIPRVGWMAVFPIWFLLSAYINRTFLSKIFRKGFSIIIFVILVLLATVFSGNLTTVTARDFFAILVSYTVYIFLSNKEFSYYSKFIVGFYVIEHFFQVLYGIYMLNKNPKLIREILTSTNERFYPFMLSFAGTYVSVVLCIYIIARRRELKKRYKFFAYLLLVLQIIIIVGSNLATPLLVFVFFAVIAFISKNKYQTIGIIITSLIGYFVFKSLIGDVLVAVSKNEAISVIITQKLYELGMLLKGKIVYTPNGTFNFRIELMKKSIEVIGSNILLGVYGTSEFGKLGGHTTWIDFIASFGILRGMFFIRFGFEFFRQIRYNCISDYEKHALFLLLILLVVLGFLNPILKPTITSFYIICLPNLNFAYKEAVKNETKY